MTLIELAQTTKNHIDEVRRLQAAQEGILDGDGTGILSSLFALDIDLSKSQEQALQSSSALAEAILALDAYHSGVRNG